MLLAIVGESTLKKPPKDNTPKEANVALDDDEDPDDPATQKR